MDWVLFLGCAVLVVLAGWQGARLRGRKVADRGAPEEAGAVLERHRREHELWMRLEELEDRVRVMKVDLDQGVRRLDLVQGRQADLERRFNGMGWTRCLERQAKFPPVAPRNDPPGPQREPCSGL